MGLWGSDAWNGEAAFPDAVEISDDGTTLWTADALRSMGLALPADYDGSDQGARTLFVYVNAFHDDTGLVGGYVFRVDNSAVSHTCGPSGDPLLASIAVHGDADTGKMMVGVYMDWNNDHHWPEEPLEGCQSVAVYHTEELDFCCPQWDGACKDPSGPYLALVSYTPDGDKAYATTSGALDPMWFNQPPGPFPMDPFWGGWGDESAFSVSLDDGVSFNQLGLIDTDIDWVSDVAICPDCGVIYMSTINATEYIPVEACSMDIYERFETSCDSIWRSYDEGDTWERVNHGDWSEDPADALLLRLPCDELEECCTVYLARQNTNYLQYSRDCGQCWSSPPKTKIVIQDVAVETENIVYVLNSAGEVSKSTSYGRRPGDAVDVGTDSGHTIAACCTEDLVVVGGTDGDSVAFSEDGGDSWTSMDDIDAGADGLIHVACDTTCDGTIYAAVSDGDAANKVGGIWRVNIGDGSWAGLNAQA